MRRRSSRRYRPIPSVGDPNALTSTPIDTVGAHPVDEPLTRRRTDAEPGTRFWARAHHATTRHSDEDTSLAEKEIETLEAGKNPSPRATRNRDEPDPASPTVQSVLPKAARSTRREATTDNAFW